MVIHSEIHFRASQMSNNAKYVTKAQPIKSASIFFYPSIMQKSKSDIIKKHNV